MAEATQKRTASGKATTGSGEVPKRLTPSDDTTRRLYLLSGNNCAVPDCQAVIVDRKGAIVGDIAHIEGALPDSARFNPKMTNEQRRMLPNLLLLCAAHHRQVDHKGRVADWPVERLRKIKSDHEAKFGAIGEGIRQSFKRQYKDTTDDLGPTVPTTFARLDAMPGSNMDGEDERRTREKDLRQYVGKLRVVPDPQREFMSAVLRRWQKVRDPRRHWTVSVDVDDLKSALNMSAGKIRRLGEALSRYDVGGYGEVGFPDGDRWHVSIADPSDYLPWAEITEFCSAHSLDLASFVERLDFAQLD